MLRSLCGLLFIIVLVACRPEAMPITPSPTFDLHTPTQVQTVTPIATSTSIKASATEARDKHIIFSRTYGESTIYETGRFITPTSDGGYLVTGAANGCWILKLNASGERQWESTFGQELNEEFQLPNNEFLCWLAKQTPNGDYVIMGVANDDFRTVQKPFIITLDYAGKKLSGQLIIEKAGKIPYLDREGNIVWLTSLSLPGTVFETLDGGYIVIGRYKQSNPDSNMHMVKIDKNGAYTWDKNLCLDKNIHQAWEQEIVCSYNNVFDAIQLQDDSFVITGVDKGAWLLKTDPNGNIDWLQSYQGEVSSSSGHALIPMSDGGYLIAGDKVIDHKNLDGLLIGTDNTGNFQWLKTYGGDRDDTLMAMQQGPDGKIIIMGMTGLFNQGASDLWLLGIDSTIFQ